MDNIDNQLSSIKEAVLKKTNVEPHDESTALNDDNKPCVNVTDDHIELKQKIIGYDFNKGINYQSLLQSYLTTGFQATNFALAIKQIESMLLARQETFEPDDFEEDIFIRRQNGCTIFLGYTSNIISSGVRETLRFLVEHRMIDCIVTTGGGVEEDLIKCFASTYLGDFDLSGRQLRQSGINRIGNLLVPNDNYCLFEDWIMPILNEMLKEQKLNQIVWTPSKMIERLGKEINNEESVLYWASKNHIPIFCPAITDGSLGDMIFMHSFRNPGLVIDLVDDIRRINMISLKAKQTGMIILGGGLVKHHICNANLMRNGADYSVFINTGQEFDGSDSGARPDEAISWGKIKSTSKPVKLYCDITLIFPLIVAETFAKYHHYSLSKKLP